jgi:hypothetical protein
MGTVYRARHVPLNREVALKVVRAEKLTPTMLARLKVEARAVAQFDHPHIVKVYEVGECRFDNGDRPVPYVALEYVPGGSLQKRLARETLAPEEAARLVMLLARAMHHAHQKGIVHRDLKPDNVLLAPPADEPALNTALGCPKITDFGLALQASSDDRLTQTGSVVGTPAYMAPEQADGRSDLGPACVIYALGAILYRLLAGRVPFEADSIIDVLYQVRHQPPAPLRQFRPDVPAGLEAICLRCLQKKPADRYPSAAALADDLACWLAAAVTGQSTTTLPGFRAPRRSGRRWWPAVVASVVPLLLAGALAGWWMLGRQKPQPDNPSLPPEPFLGSIDVVMTRPRDPLRQLARLSDPAARPLQAGDEVIIKAKLNRPAYLYVLWIDTEGTVLPVYPWIKGDWKRRPEEKPVRKLQLPEKSTRPGPPVFHVDPGPAGMETMLLLVRETPLPADVDLAKALSGLGRQGRSREEELNDVAWFENGRLVTREKERAANLKDVGESSNPVLRLQYTLRERLGGHFEYTRAVTFGNRGGK